ncbi:MAG: hypothetical protein J0L88_01470 [Xanthomonadales bacterium]|nr:hypothetical protein [Xanthomonadales bacterium]
MADQPNEFERFSRAPREGSIADRLLDFAASIPTPRTRKRADAPVQARGLARRAAVKAALTSGTLALPPGPLGWFTIAPELIAVWKMQRQLVVDIAALYGRSDEVRREHLLFCLFGHTSAGAFSDVVLRVGERWVVRQTPLTALYAIANKIALRIAQRGASRVVTRWLPVAGAAAIAGFVHADTRKVADAAIALFGDARNAQPVVLEGEAQAPVPPAPRRGRRTAVAKPRQD